MKSKEIVAKAGSEDAQPLLHQKTELATRAVDMLMFGGRTGQMIQAMGQMAGVPEVSIKLLLPTKRPDNMPRFLACLSLIISTVLDDQCDLHSFTAKLAEAIQAIQAIAEEEKE